jgi:hypothetical protein
MFLQLSTCLTTIWAVTGCNLPAFYLLVAAVYIDLLNPAIINPL